MWVYLVTYIIWHSQLPLNHFVSYLLLLYCFSFFFTSCELFRVALICLALVIMYDSIICVVPCFLTISLSAWDILSYIYNCLVFVTLFAFFPIFWQSVYDLFNVTQICVILVIKSVPFKPRQIYRHQNWLCCKTILHNFEVNINCFTSTVLFYVYFESILLAELYLFTASLARPSF